jgi:hypothetical protein
MHTDLSNSHGTHHRGEKADNDITALITQSKMMGQLQTRL